MMISKIALNILFVLLIFPSLLSAAEPVILHEIKTKKKIGLYIEYLEDKDKTLTIEYITSKTGGHPLNWKKSQKEVPAFGYTKSAYWIRFTVENLTPREIQWYLNQNFPLMDYIFLFVPQKNGEYKKIETGDRFIFSKRPIEDRTFVFPLKSPPKSSETYYIRMESNGSMNCILSIWPPEAFQKNMNIETIFFWFYYGAIFVMFFYNLFIYIFSRELSYIFYCTYVACFVLFMMSVNGQAYQYLWPNSIWWANYCIIFFLGFVEFFLGHFIRHFVETWIHIPVRDKIYKILLALSVAFIFISVITGNYRFGLTSLVLFTGVNVVYVLSFLVYLAISKKHKNRQARLLLIAFSMMIFGAIFYVLKTLLIIPVNIFTNFTLQIGSFLEIVLLSVALADKINVMKNELKVLNENLEAKVDERTKELHAAMGELEATNESLVEARDELWGEMELAKKIQTVLLPLNPQIPGYEISAYMCPADLVGGDYYDIIDAGGYHWLVIGDVSGHGVLSGLIMMMAQTSINLVLAQNPEVEPSRLLTAVNRVLTRNIKLMDEDKYMTITILAAVKDGRFKFSGLHQDIMVYRSKTGSVEAVQSTGMWIGILDDIGDMLNDEELIIEPGDTFILYTDGITEAWEKESVKEKRSMEEDMFGDERLKIALEKHGRYSTEQIKEELLKELEGYDCFDDVTMVLVKRLR